MLTHCPLYPPQLVYRPYTRKQTGRLAALMLYASFHGALSGVFFLNPLGKNLRYALVASVYLINTLVVAALVRLLAQEFARLGLYRDGFKNVQHHYGLNWVAVTLWPAVASRSGVVARALQWLFVRVVWVDTLPERKRKLTVAEVEEALWRRLPAVARQANLRERARRELLVALWLCQGGVTPDVAAAVGAFEAMGTAGRGAGGAGGAGDFAAVALDCEAHRKQLGRFLRLSPAARQALLRRPPPATAEEAEALLAEAEAAAAEQQQRRSSRGAGGGAAATAAKAADNNDDAEAGNTGEKPSSSATAAADPAQQQLLQGAPQVRSAPNRVGLPLMRRLFALASSIDGPGGGRGAGAALWELFEACLGPAKRGLVRAASVDGQSGGDGYADWAGGEQKEEKGQLRKLNGGDSGGGMRDSIQSMMRQPLSASAAATPPAEPSLDGSGDAASGDAAGAEPPPRMSSSFAESAKRGSASSRGNGGGAAGPAEGAAAAAAAEAEPSASGLIPTAWRSSRVAPEPTVAGEAVAQEALPPTDEAV